MYHAFRSDFWRGSLFFLCAMNVVDINSTCHPRVTSQALALLSRNFFIGYRQLLFIVCRLDKIRLVISISFSFAVSVIAALTMLR